MLIKNFNKLLPVVVIFLGGSLDSGNASSESKIIQGLGYPKFSPDLIETLPDISQQELLLSGLSCLANPNFLESFLKKLSPEDRNIFFLRAKNVQHGIDEEISKYSSIDNELHQISPQTNLVDRDNNSVIGKLIDQAKGDIQKFGDTWEIRVIISVPGDFDETNLKKSVELIDHSGTVTTVVNSPLKMKLTPKFLELNKKMKSSVTNITKQKIVNIDMKVSNSENLLCVMQLVPEQFHADIFVSSEQLQSLDRINEALSRTSDKLLFEFSKIRNEKLLRDTCIGCDKQIQKLQEFWDVIQKFRSHINDLLDVMRRIGGKFYDLETAVLPINELLKKIEPFLEK